MRRVRVAASALNQTPLDWKGNRDRIIEAIKMARDAGVNFLCLPEMCITGYGCEDFFHSIDVQDRAYDTLEEITRGHTKDIVVSMSLPFCVQNALYNVASLSYNGSILGMVPKQNLASDGVHYESRWFKPWERGIANDDGSFGDTHFIIGGILLGFEICEDAWVADRPGSSLAKKGVDIIFNPSASHFAFGRDKVRKQFVIEGSRAFNVTYVYSNLLGNEAGRVIYGGDTLIASGGRLIAEGQQLSFKDVILTTAVVDVDDTRRQQMQSGAFRPDLKRADTGHFVDTHIKTADIRIEDNVICTGNEKQNKFDEFSRAVALGLFDYMRKSRSKGFLISLSGGADSAACAALVRIMCELGVKELGVDKFNKKSGIGALVSTKCTDDVYIDSAMKMILTCVYQGTNNSSDTTLNAARTLAKEIKARFYHWHVEEIVGKYSDLVSESIQRNLSWETDDIAMQNIQARVRAPGIWMLANMTGELLLSTSNRSEASVGYATMDGDTCGGLAPITGVDKRFILQWIDYLVFVKGWRPALEQILNQKPTAELRPSEDGQTDETDLMPYSVLDTIERLAIHRKKSPKEVLQILEDSNDKDERYAEWIKKFFRLWARNQWKRERYAPSFHLDDANVDPKTWCRFPILSGGFEKELEEL